MASGGLPRPHGCIHRNLFIYSVGRAETHEKSQTLQIDVAFDTLQFTNGCFERVHFGAAFHSCH